MKTLKCPRCGNGKTLSLIETYDSTGVTDFGEIRYDERGGLIPPGDFIFEPGGTIAVHVQCEGCQHEWKPRSQTISSERLT